MSDTHANQLNALETPISQHASLRTADRRNQYFRSFLYSFFKKQRRSIRRNTDDKENTFVDFHEVKLGVIFVITLVLCISDAFLTLLIINHGGEEVNPFMKYLMDLDIYLFFWAKFFITAFGMLFLISHKNFTFYRVITGYQLFYGIAVIYVCLINYEFYLISQIV